MFLLVGPLRAADNELTPAEKADGYVLLFNGKDLDGFKPPGTLNYCKWIVEEGAIRTCLFGGWAKYVSPGHLYTTREFENYILKLDVKVPPAPKGTHSGVILRVGGTPRDEEAAGLEINIYGVSQKPGNYTTGAFRHDIRAPTKEMLNKDGDWNSFVITVNKNLINVELNGEKINELNLDEWDTAGKRPDGTAHKLTKVALKDLPRKDRIGFRDDHGSPVWFKNIKLKPLP
jgi:hypothetical protein